MKRTLLLGLVAVTLVLSACAPAAPPPPPPGPAFGFDTCAAPSVSAMHTWATTSPYSSVGIYIGGANRGCAQPNLNAGWVGTVTSYGWKLLPIWVGPQASCTTLGSTTKISSDPAQALAAGKAEANAAANAADALGFTWLAPVYYDMEAYPRGGACSVSVQAFVIGWVGGLNSRGYRAGFYSSLCSGILDVAAIYGSPYFQQLNAVWIAAWNDTPNIFGFGPPCALSDDAWANHERVHQYNGGHNEGYGGVTINLDSHSVDGPTWP